MRSFLLFSSLLGAALAAPSERRTYGPDWKKIERLRGVAQASIRTSWEQGTLSMAELEWKYPQYSAFGSSPFKKKNGKLPVEVLQYALSAVERQSKDGRLSQLINDGKDGAALDGASSAPAVLLGMIADPERKDLWTTAIEKQFNYLLTMVPKTKSGAISMRNDTRQYWSDGAYMGFPCLALGGVIMNNQTLVQLAYDNLRLYRDALIVKDAPYGPAWGHLYDDDADKWSDKGIWGTGNGWAIKGLLQVAATIEKSQFKSDMAEQLTALRGYIQEILDGVLPAFRHEDGLLPNYIDKPAEETFGDAAGSALIAATVYRAAKLWPKQFKKKEYLDVAHAIHKTILAGIDDLGLVHSLVDPLHWDKVGRVSTEGQSFVVMLQSAWRDYSK